jgi:hypothetical protein
MTMGLAQHSSESEAQHDDRNLTGLDVSQNVAVAAQVSRHQLHSSTSRRLRTGRTTERQHSDS